MAGQAQKSWDLSDGDSARSLRRNCILYLFIINTVVMGTIAVGGVIGNSLAFVVLWKDTIKTSASCLPKSGAHRLCVSTGCNSAVPNTFLRFFYINWLAGYIGTIPLSTCIYTAIGTSNPHGFYMGCRAILRQPIHRRMLFI